MKIRHNQKIAPAGSGPNAWKQGGFVATLLFFALLVIMLMLATAGGMALVHLHDEVKVLEQQQIKRLDLSVTNSAAISRPGATRIVPK